MDYEEADTMENHQASEFFLLAGKLLPLSLTNYHFEFSPLFIIQIIFLIFIVHKFIKTLWSWFWLPFMVWYGKELAIFHD